MHQEGGCIGQILVGVLSAADEIDVAGVKRYFALHLSRIDYSTVGDIRPGLGVVMAANSLGLVGEVGR